MIFILISQPVFIYNLTFSQIELIYLLLSLRHHLQKLLFSSIPFDLYSFPFVNLMTVTLKLDLAIIDLFIQLFLFPFLLPKLFLERLIFCFQFFSFLNDTINSLPYAFHLSFQTLSLLFFGCHNFQLSFQCFQLLLLPNSSGLYHKYQELRSICRVFLLELKEGFIVQDGHFYFFLKCSGLRLQILGVEGLISKMVTGFQNFAVIVLVTHLEQIIKMYQHSRIISIKKINDFFHLIVSLFVEMIQSKNGLFVNNLIQFRIFQVQQLLIMYIGASFKCDQYCQQDDKHKYDKSHIAHRHTIIDSETFRQENNMFIRKSKRAWNSFSIRLQSFFKKLKNQLNFIEKQAFNRLQLQEIKSAIKTQDKHLRNISMDIFQARYRNLTCQDIDQFLKLRKRHQGSEPINIQREEDQFALDLLHQINSFVLDMSQELAPKNEPKNFRNFDDRNNHKQRDNQRQRDYNRERGGYNRERDNNRDRDPNREKDMQRERDYQKYRQTNRNIKENNDRYPKRNQQKPERNKQRQQRRQQKRQERRPPRREERQQHKKQLRVRDDQQNSKKEVKTNAKQQKIKEKEPCPLMKIEQLKSNSKAFDIDLKILSFVKNIYGKEMWRAFDESGQIMLVVPTHNAVKEGAKIRMHNCYVKTFNQKLEIYTKENSKISYQNVRQQACKFDQNAYRKHNKNGKQQKNLTKIEELTPDSQNFKLVAKVISIEVIKQSQKKCVLGDETGIVNGRFKGYDELLKVGQILYFRGLQVDVDKCGHMYVTGSKVLVELAHDDIKSVKLSNNISHHEYQLIEN